MKDQTSAREIVDEHIRWAERVAVPVLPSNDRADISRLCGVIRERNADRPLRVGVFGQFSSGKSTLLNALLGAGLLPSSARVATSLVTRLCPAEADSLRVTLGAGSRVLDFGTSRFGAWYAKTVGSPAPSGIRAALQGIMRSPRAAQTVRRLDLGLRGTVLGPGVVVMDTPGFDATDTGHDELAREVADEVDLAIVLIPANDPGSMSLAQFLHDVLGDLADRCVFVLTKFRQIPAAERADLQQHIVSWLAAQGFAHATVIRADATDIAVAAADVGDDAAGGALGGALGGSAPEISAADALAETLAIAEQLRALAADRRQQLIEATLKVLLGRLLTGVTTAADDRRGVLEAARARLDDVPIVDLADFLLGWRNDVTYELARSAQRALSSARWEAAPDYALERACDRAVEAVGSRNDVKSIAAELISETEDILDDWMRDALRTAVADTAEDLADEADELRQTFTGQYAELAELTGSDPQPPDFEYSSPSLSVPYVDLSDALDRMRAKGGEIQGVATAKNLSGAAAGAALGTIFFPGIGTVIGGVLGWAAGSGRGKQQQQFREAAQVLHSDAMAAARDGILTAEPDLREVLDKAVDQLIARYLSSAGPVVEQLTDAYRAQVSQLDARLHEVLVILSDAKLRKAELTEHGLRSR